MGQAYTLLIADDEFFILERLKRLLTQEQTDFPLLSACSRAVFWSWWNLHRLW